MQYFSSSSRQTDWPKRSAYWVYISLAGLIVLLLTTTRPVAAQTGTPNVKLTAHSMFDGHFKYGDWLPIGVELENYGEAVNVQVQAAIVTRINGSSYTTSYQREVNLGERANKRVVLYIVPYVETSNPSRAIVYETSIILKAGDRKLDEQKVRLQPNQPTDYIVGAVTADPNALTNLNNLKLGGLRYPVTNLTLSLDDIPDLATGLHSFNALIFSQVSTESLTNEQRTALRGWVEDGGQLILMGGSGWARVRSAFNDPQLLPLEVNGYGNVNSLNGLISLNGEEIKNPAPLSRPAGIAHAGVMKDAHLLSYLPDGPNILPVIAEKRIGAGRVVATTLDLSQNPLADWSNTTQLWQEIFAFNLTNPIQLYSEINPQVKNATDMLGFVSNVNELRLPDITPFLALLLGYVVLIAPLNYLVLKKLKRPELAWITIPVLGVVFTGLALNYATAQLPGQVLINQMTVVQSAPDQQSAEVRSYAAIFSPEDRRYTVGSNATADQTSNRLLITPLNRSTSNTVDEASRPVFEGDRARLEDFQVGQWNAQGFAVETRLPGQSYQITANLHYEDNKIVGTVRNNTGSPLRSNLLILGDQVIKLRDVIEAGEIVPVEFALPLPTAAVPAYCTNYPSSSSYSSNTTADKLTTLLQQDHRDDKAVLNRANFLRKLYESGRYSPLNPQRGLDLIGWMDQNPLPLGIGGLTSESKSSQVLIARLPVGLETGSGDGHLLIPSMAFWPETAQSSTGQSPFTSRVERTDQICVPPRSNVTVQFQLPGGQSSFKLKQLTLYLNSFSTSGGRRDPTLPDSVEFYNFQTKSWQQPIVGLKNSAQPVLTGNNFSNVPPPVKNPIEDAARFADPNTGRILVRITAGSTGLFVQHGLEVEGSRN